MNDHNRQENISTGNKRLAAKLALAVVGMFAFGFALVPLYDVICDITGLNGKTAGRYESSEAELVVNQTRSIQVQFMAQNAAGMQWEFRPNEPLVTVSPGEIRVISYKARNPTDKVMVGQAIPSIAPNAAAQHLNKLECFCFQEQVLQPGEEVDMAIRFFVDEAISERINKLTLSYSLYDITASSKAGKEIASNR
ncbi:MAG: cytochrome c oxidase assembly protein [Pseudomonadales bacterium]|nr:cytochrome c oxidase assembly protein [Pseudomonadales bacterium]